MDAINLTGRLNLTVNTAKVEAQLAALGKQAPIKITATLPTAQLRAYREELTRVRKASKEVEDGFSDFAEKAALAGKRFAAFTVATTGFFALASAIKSGISTASDFEVELLRVQQVTRESARNISGLKESIFGVAKGLGVSSKELLSVGLTLGQAGRSIQEIKDSLAPLAKTRLAATFGDITDTVNALIAAQEQFKVTSKDTEQVLGSINVLSAKYAVEAQDLTTAIQKAGGAFSSFADSAAEPKKNLNELLALFTAVRSTTRESADTIATGFRTIFARLRNPKNISALEAFGINLKDDKGLLLKPLEQIRAISRAVKDLDKRDIRFSQIIEEVGGIRQQSKVIPLLEQMEKAEQALVTATQGANSLTRDAQIAQESLANQLAKTREEFLKLINDGFSSEEFKTFAKTALGIASALIKVGEAIGPLLPAFATLAATKFILPDSAGQLSGYQKVFKAVHGQFGPKELPKKFAKGGIVPGIGNTDSVPAMLTPGELVVPKGEVQKFATGGAVDKFGHDRLRKFYDKISQRYGKTGTNRARIGSFEQFNTGLNNILEYNPDKFTPNNIRSQFSLYGFNTKDMIRQASTNANFGPLRELGVPIKTRLSFGKNAGIAEYTGHGNTIFDTDKISQVKASKRQEYINRIVKHENVHLLDDFIGNDKNFSSGIGFSGGSTTLGGALAGSFSSNSGKLSGIASKLSRFANKVYNISGDKLKNRDTVTSPHEALAYSSEDLSDKELVDLFSGKGNYKQLKRNLRNRFAKSTSLGRIRPPRFKEGGNVEGSGHPDGVDTVPAYLTKGEFVIPKDAASKVGHDFLEKVRKGEKPKGYALGGVVGKITESPTQSAIGGLLLGSLFENFSQADEAAGRLGKALTAGATQFLLLNSILGTFGRTAKQTRILEEESQAYIENKDTINKRKDAISSAKAVKSDLSIVSSSRDAINSGIGYQQGKLSDITTELEKNRITPKRREDLVKVRALQRVNEKLSNNPNDQTEVKNYLAKRIKNEDLNKATNTRLIKKNEDELKTLSNPDAIQKKKDRIAELKAARSGAISRKQYFEEKLKEVKVNTANPAGVKSQVASNQKEIDKILKADPDILQSATIIASLQSQKRDVQEKIRKLKKSRKQSTDNFIKLEAKYKELVKTEEELKQQLATPAQKKQFKESFDLQNNKSVTGSLFGIKFKRRTKADLERDAKRESIIAGTSAVVAGLGGLASSFGQDALKNTPDSTTGRLATAAGSAATLGAEFAAIGTTIHPLVGGFAGLGGAIIGFTKSLIDSGSNIRDIAIDKSLVEFSKIVELTNDKDKKALISNNIGKASLLVKSVQSNVLSNNSKESRDKAESLAGNIQVLLRGFAQNIGESTGSIQQFNSESKTLIEFASRFGNTPIKDLNEQFHKLIKETSQLTKITKEQSDISQREQIRALASVSLLNTFEDMSSSIGEFETILNGGMSDLSNVFKRIGNISDSKLLGRANAQASSILDSVPGGKEFLKENQLINDIGRELPTLLIQAFKKGSNPLEGSGDQIGDFADSLSERFKLPESSSVKDSIVGQLRELTKNKSPDEIYDLIQNNLKSGLLDPILANLTKVGDVSAQSIQLRNQESKLLESTFAKISELVSRKDELSLSNLDIEEKRQSNKTTRGLGLEKLLGFDAQKLSILSGQNDNSIGNLSKTLEESRTKIEQLDKDKQTADSELLKSINESRQSEVDKIEKTTKALKFLADASTRVAHIEERISREKSLREGKLGILRQYAFGSPDQKREIAQNAQAAKQLLDGGIGAVPPNLRQGAFQFAEQFKDSYYGDKTIGDRLDEEAIRSIGGDKGIGFTKGKSEKDLELARDVKLQQAKEANSALQKDISYQTKNLADAINKQFPEFISAINELVVNARKGNLKIQIAQQTSKLESAQLQKEKAERLSSLVSGTKFSDVSKVDLTQLGDLAPKITRLKDINNQIRSIQNIKESGLQLTNKKQISLDEVYSDVRSRTNTLFGDKKSIEIADEVVSRVQGYGKNISGGTANVAFDRVLEKYLESTSRGLKKDKESAVLDINKSELGKDSIDKLYRNIGNINIVLDELSQVSKGKSLSDLNRQFNELSGSVSKLRGGLSGFEFVGPIKRATGGGVPGLGNFDSVPAMLTPGEFVIKKSAAEAIGHDNLHAMNRGGRVRFDKGGEVKEKYGLKYYAWGEQLDKPKAKIEKTSLSDAERRRAHLRGEAVDPRLNIDSFGKYGKTPNEGKDGSIKLRGSGSTQPQYPKGFTGPKFFDKKSSEDFAKARQLEENKRLGRVASSVSNNVKLREENGVIGSLSENHEETYNKFMTRAKPSRGNSYFKNVGNSSTPNDRRLAAIDSRLTELNKDKVKSYSVKNSGDPLKYNTGKREDSGMFERGSRQIRAQEAMKRLDRFDMSIKDFKNKRTIYPGAGDDLFKAEKKAVKRFKVYSKAGFSFPGEKPQKFEGGGPVKPKSEEYYRMFPEERPEAKYNAMSDDEKRRSHLRGESADSRLSSDSFGKYAKVKYKGQLFGSAIGIDSSNPTFINEGKDGSIELRGSGGSSQTQYHRNFVGPRPFDKKASEKFASDRQLTENERLGRKVSSIQNNQKRREELGISGSLGGVQQSEDPYNKFMTRAKSSRGNSYFKNVGDSTSPNDKRMTAINSRLAELNKDKQKSYSVRNAGNALKYNQDKRDDLGMFARGNRKIQTQESFKRLDRFDMEMEDFRNKKTPYPGAGNALFKAEKKAVNKYKNYSKAPFSFPGEKPLQRAFGGEIPGHGNMDTVPALLTPGEFVINKRSAERLGQNTLHKLNGTLPKKFEHGGNVAGSGGSEFSSGSCGITCELNTESLEKFNKAITNFSKSADPLAVALEKFPKEFTMQGEHNVHVMVTGADALASLEDTFGKLVEAKIKKSINETTDRVFGGSVARMV